MTSKKVKAQHRIEDVLDWSSLRFEVAEVKRLEQDLSNINREIQTLKRLGPRLDRTKHEEQRDDIYREIWAIKDSIYMELAEAFTRLDR